MAKEKSHPKSWKETSAAYRGRLPRPFLRCEWYCEWAAYHLSKWAFLEVLEYLGKLSIMVAVVLWIYPGIKERKQIADDSKKSRHYVAWQTINSAVGKPGNAGRADALEDLSRDSVPLNGISLAGGTILIGPLNLSKARMERADFSGGSYEQVNFSLTELSSSRWNDVSCKRCDFSGAMLWDATFKHSTFASCDFGYAKEGDKAYPCLVLPPMGGYEGAQFSVCNFYGMVSPAGVWSSVNFQWCNLAFTDFGHTVVGTNVSMFCCNLFGAKTSSPEFIKWAFGQHLAFTNITSLDEWYYAVTNRIVLYQTGGPQFMQWASNQFTSHIETNNPQAWLDWSRENLPALTPNTGHANPQAK